MIDMSGKVALVTGSSRGIGKSIAEHLARAGARVVISSRKAEACDNVVREMHDAGFEAMAVPCNVSHKDQLRNLVDSTLDAWGRIDALVCNAATNPVYGPLKDISDEAFDKIMGTNVRSTFWLCNMVLPQMADRRDGAVVLLSSIAALRGNPAIGVYGISKAAEAQLARNLAVEWGRHNIRVNAIAPGLVRTDFARALWENPQLLQATEEKTPLKRIGEPNDIGGLALFLASPMARFITGQVIVADGGVTISDVLH